MWANRKHAREDKGSLNKPDIPLGCRDPHSSCANAHYRAWESLTDFSGYDSHGPGKAHILATETMSQWEIMKSDAAESME